MGEPPERFGGTALAASTGAQDVSIRLGMETKVLMVRRQKGRRIFCLCVRMEWRAEGSYRLWRRGCGRHCSAAPPAALLNKQPRPTVSAATTKTRRRRKKDESEMGLAHQA